MITKHDVILRSSCFCEIYISHKNKADEGNNSVFESFSILSVLVFIEVSAIIFCLLFLDIYILKMVCHSMMRTSYKHLRGPTVRGPTVATNHFITLYYLEISPIL